MVLYPEAYGTKMTTLDGMIAKHGDKMHPEFRRRFFAYIESKDGLFGVGGGFRVTQPNKAGFAPPGKSFHQNQKFKSGITAYSAVDLVRLRPGGGVHMSPSWDDCADAPEWSLHTFISGEPWHIQCIEMRGFQSWVSAGRKDPPLADLPSELLPGADMFQPIQPIRNSDTRVFGTALTPGDVHTFTLSSAIPANAAAVALNVTVISPTKPGYLVVWPSGPTPPTATVNFAPGEIINGSAIIGVKNGKFNIKIAGSSAHVTVDVTGYWTPAE